MNHPNNTLDDDGVPPVVVTPELVWQWARARAIKELEQVQAFGGLLPAQLRTEKGTIAEGRDRRRHSARQNGSLYAVKTPRGSNTIEDY